jgi:hypothetical protein
MGNNIVTIDLTEVLGYNVPGVVPVSGFCVEDNEAYVSL